MTTPQTGIGFVLKLLALIGKIAFWFIKIVIWIWKRFFPKR